MKNNKKSHDKLNKNKESFKRKLENSRISTHKHQNKTKIKANVTSTNPKNISNNTQNTNKSKTTPPSTIVMKNSKSHPHKTFSINQTSLKTIKVDKAKSQQSKKPPTPSISSKPSLKFNTKKMSSKSKTTITKKPPGKKFYYINNQTLQKTMSKIINNNKLKSHKLLGLKKKSHLFVNK